MAKTSARPSSGSRRTGERSIWELNILAQLRFKDVPAYRRYQAAFPAVFAKFGGRVLIADEAPAPLEGELNFDKVVLLEFPDADEARRFANAPEYAEIAADRIRGADCVFTLLKGR